MDERKQDLCKYRMAQAKETLVVAKECYQNKHYKDSINRSYYAAFYAVKSVTALGTVDFKRHKDVMSYFTKTLLPGTYSPERLARDWGESNKSVKNQTTTTSILLLLKKLRNNSLLLKGLSLPLQII